ncbi:hypothetical protein TNIN_58191 [Trichonephila inaurata madagascariensis]|uniref:Uncharacterized protein n=1 Tax=Trichonephila inaurata madagascariensis TaxID=2747483 RepID=A0A8X6YSX0_9ARAC|nr:hypothetical protein TNIN_58191 [Trichonephila inaurata madagascariensis]
MAAEKMDDNTQMDYRIKISGKAPLKEHKGRFKAPSVREVAIMIAGELGDHRDIVLHSRSFSQMQVLGLLENYSHWYQAMEEADVSQSPAQLRNLFAILVAVCG